MDLPGADEFLRAVAVLEKTGKSHMERKRMLLAGPHCESHASYQEDCVPCIEVAEELV